LNRFFGKGHSAKGTAVVFQLIHHFEVALETPRALASGACHSEWVDRKLCIHTTEQFGLVKVEIVVRKQKLFKAYQTFLINFLRVCQESFQ
jgi:hypothetical protein